MEVLSETVDQIQQDQPPSKVRALYDVVSKDYNLGTFEDFSGKMKNPAKRKAFYDGVGKEYQLGSFDEFNIKLDEGLKKKESTVGSGLQDGGLESTTSTIPPTTPKKATVIVGETTEAKPKDFTPEIPEINLYETSDGELIPLDNTVALSKKVGNLMKQTNVPRVTGGTGGAGVSFVLDEKKLEEANKLKAALKERGFDATEIMEQYKYVPDDIAKKPGFRPEDKAANPQEYARKLGAATWQPNLREAIYELSSKEDIPQKEIDDVNDLITRYQKQGYLYQYRREMTDNIRKLINTYVDDDKKKEAMLKGLATDAAISYGMDTDEQKQYVESAPERKFLDYDQTLAIQYLKDTNPELAKGYDAVMVDPEQLKKVDEQAYNGWQFKAVQLKRIGVQLRQLATTEQLNALQNKKDSGQFTEQDAEKFNELLSKNQELESELSNVSEKYPLPFVNESFNDVQEILGSQLIEKEGSASYILHQIGKSSVNTVNGIIDMATEPFRSDESSKAHQLSILANNMLDESFMYRNQGRQGLQTFEMAMPKEMSEKVNQIKNDPSLSYDEKFNKILDLRLSNPKDFVKVPIKNGRLNINPASALYSVTDLVSALTPYIAIEAATGGGATAGIGRKFLASFGAAATTAFHEELANAIKNNEANPYFHAAVSTAISAANMAGAGTASMVKKMINPKTAIGEIINKMDDAAIEAIIKKSNPTLKAFGKAINVGKAVGGQLLSGVKEGAAFEAKMIPSKIIATQMQGGEFDPEQMAKQSIVTIIGMAGLAGAGVRGKYKQLNELERGSFLKASEAPEKFISAANRMLIDGIITKEKYQEVITNIETAAKVAKGLKYVDDNGNSLSEQKKADLLVAKIQEAKLNEQKSGDVPEGETNPTLKDAERKEKSFEDAKEGDLITHNGKEVTIVGRGKSRGGSDIIVVKQNPRTKSEIKADALQAVFNKVAGQYKNLKPTWADIEANHPSEVRAEIDRLTELENSRTATYTIDAEQWDNDVLGGIKKEVGKPVSEVSGVPEGQGTKETVSKDTDGVGQGKSEATTTVLSEREVVPTEKPTEGKEVELPVTKSGLTEAEREKLIQQREKKTAIPEKDKETQDILNDISKYNKLPNGRLGKLKPDGLKSLNKIREKVRAFNDKHGTNYSFDDRSGKLYDKNKKGLTGAVKGKNVYDPDSGIDRSGKPLRERDKDVIDAFDQLMEVGALPTGYGTDGRRMSSSQLDATVQDILDGIPSRRANNYLDALEKMIEKDDFDFSTKEFPQTQAIRLSDVVDIKKENTTEPMSEKDIDEWLSRESEMTPEDEMVFDNIDNLITEYEIENESKGEVEQPIFRTEEVVGAEAKPNEPTGAGIKESEPTEKPGKYESAARKLADKIQSATIVPDWLKVSDPNIKTKGASEQDLKKALADATVLMGKLLDKGVEFGEAVKQAVSGIVAMVGETAREQIEKGFADDYRGFGAEYGVAPKEELLHSFLYKGSQKERVSGLMSHLMEAKNLTKKEKEGFEREGIKYKVADFVEAEELAGKIISAFGKEDALQIARGNDMHPSVRSAIFAKSIDNSYLAEREAKTPEEKLKAAEEWKDLSFEYDELLTGGGQFTAYAGHFYRRSPMGFVMKVREAKKAEFDSWYKDKEKSYQEIWDELNKTAEGKEFFRGKMEEYKKTERKQARIVKRAKVHKSIDESIDKWIKNLTPDSTKGIAKKGAGVEEVLKALGTTLKLAYDAGDKIADVADKIQEAIDKISKIIGRDDWDKESFRKEQEEKFEEFSEAGDKKSEQFLNTLEKRKAELERRLSEKDFSAEEYKEKRTLSDKEKAAKEAYDKVKSEYDEARKSSPEYIKKKSEQFLQRFGEKLKGLTDEQKKQVVNRSMKHLLENGALGKEEFRKIIAEAIGFKDLTPEQVARIEELNVKINSVEDAENKFVENPTKENYEEFVRIKKEGQSATLELGALLKSKRNIWDTLSSLVTGSLLGAQTLIQNIGGNIIFQPLVRFPHLLARRGVEMLTYGISMGNPAFKPTTSIRLAQKGYLGNLPKAVKSAAFDFRTGTAERDLFDKTSYQTQLSPRQAWKELKLWKKGELFLGKDEVFDRVIRTTLGRQADVILRGMAFGDKPFRWAAESSKAVQIAFNELDITPTDSNMLAFMVSPKKTAIKILMEKGKTKEEATEQATEIEDRIQKEGSKAVFEVDTGLSTLSKSIDVALRGKADESKGIKAIKGATRFGKTLTFPFVRIPAYMYWVSFKLANPIISVAQSSYYAKKAYDAANKGDNAGFRSAIEKSKDAMAMAALGVGYSLAAKWLVSNGLVNPPSDDDQSKREREGSKPYGKPGTINLGQLLGSDDFFVDLKWFGPLGTQLLVESKMQAERKKEASTGETKEHGWVSDRMEKMTESAAYSFNNLIFDQGERVVNVLKGQENGWSTLGVNYLGAAQNMITGATYSAISKAMLPEEVSLKADGTMDRIVNDAKNRNFLLRMAFSYPPSKVSIWGDPIKKNNTIMGVVGNVLGFQMNEKLAFGAILYDDYQRTGNPNFFPPPMTKEIKVDGKEAELTQPELSELEKEVGKVRKILAAPLVADMAEIRVPKYDENGVAKGTETKKYNECSDKQKLFAITEVYKKAREVGIEQFKLKNPKYKDAKFDIDKEKTKAWEEAMRELWDAKMGSSIKKAGINITQGQDSINVGESE